MDPDLVRFDGRAVLSGVCATGMIGMMLVRNIVIVGACLALTAGLIPTAGAHQSGPAGFHGDAGKNSLPRLDAIGDALRDDNVGLAARVAAGR